MTVLTRESSFTAEDLLTMRDGERYELVDGTLVEKQMGAESDWIANRLSRRITTLVEEAGLGFAFGSETGYQCFSSDGQRVRKPDASFIRQGRLPGGRIPRGHVRIPPDLAVEVVSPNDLFSEVRIKVEEYLDAGVRLVWVVDPDTRIVEVHQSDRTVVILRAGDELAGGEVLPGFRCRVEDLFPPQSESDAGEGAA